MNKLKEILIRRLEGPANLCDKDKVFLSYEEAKNWLISQSYSFPLAGGYHKHHCLVTWKDGSTFRCVLNCKNLECPNNDLDVRLHVANFFEDDKEFQSQFEI